jgi:hypothetical protein
VNDDIVARLQEMLDGPVPFVIGREDVRDAIVEIERLREQVTHAHAVLASEGAAWLVLGSNHATGWRQSLTPAIQAYWEKYGNYFKGDRRG